MIQIKSKVRYVSIMWLRVHLHIPTKVELRVSNRLNLLYYIRIVQLRESTNI